MEPQSGENNCPLYLQLARWVEDEIVKGTLEANNRVFSQNELAAMAHVNVATAAKGLSCLLDERAIYRKRGIGMFVESRAKTIIIEKRRARLFECLTKIIAEAEMFGISREELIHTIKSTH